MRVTNRQVRKLMMEYQKTGQVGMAALKAGMHRETVGRYIKSGQLPSEGHAERGWRTRTDPFEEHWPQIEQMLVPTPGAGADGPDRCRMLLCGPALLQDVTRGDAPLAGSARNVMRKERGFGAGIRSIGCCVEGWQVSC